jgi:hypothetical protein
LKGGRATSSSSKLLAEGTAARSTGNNSETHEGRPKARRVAMYCWLAHGYHTSPVAVLLDGAVVHTTDDAEEAILTPVRAPAVPHCTPIAQHTTGAGHTHNRLTRRAQDRHAHTHTPLHFALGLTNPVLGARGDTISRLPGGHTPAHNGHDVVNAVGAGLVVQDAARAAHKCTTTTTTTMSRETIACRADLDDHTHSRPTRTHPIRTY